MHPWKRHICPVCGTCIIALALLSIASCGKRTNPPVARPAVAAAIDSAWQLIDAEQFTESSYTHVRGVFHRYEPLTPIEKLKKYELAHWYYMNLRLGDYEATNRVADSALTLFKDLEFREENLQHYVTWMLFKGDALVQLRRLNDAFTYYYQVKADYLDNWNSCRLSQFTTRLGFVRYKQHNYQDAIRYYQEAYAQFLACKETSPPSTYYEAVTEPQALLNGIAWFHELEGQMDSASVYYHRALAFLENESKRFPPNEKASAIAKGVIYGNLGGMYNKLGQFDLALHYLTASIAINSLPGYDHRDVLTAQIKLAETYVNLAQYDHARQVIAECRKGLDTLPYHDYELRWRWVNWQFHDRQRNLRQAYAALNAYQALKDSIATGDHELFNADFSAEFERKEQQLAYTSLEYKNRLNFLAFVMSVVALVLLSAVVYLTFSNWRRSKRHVARLKQLTERINQRNEKLQLALLALEDSQQENTKLMAMVAHDLRNPLTNIHMAAAYLHAAADRADHPGQSKFLEIIRRSNDKALTLIQELLYSHEEKTVNEATDDIDLDVLTRDCLEIMQLRASRKDHTLVFEGEATKVRGSVEKIWRVVSNLIDNAIKFTPPGGKIVVRLHRGETEAIIEVEDSGIGIPPAYTQRLFDIENVPRRNGTDGEPSTGLGLAIVKQIVSAHGGHIHFTSSPAIGTTFFVHLPR